MISVSEMREVEKRAGNIGLKPEILMENAGANVARVLDDKFCLRRKNILVFCGLGNNAGDGLVFARHAIIYGARVFVFLVKDPKLSKSHLFRRNYVILNNLKLRKKPIKIFIRDVPDIKVDILVDALFGIGLKGFITGEFTKAIEKFNSMEGYRVSIDCPSGINSDTGETTSIAVKPELTITFYDKKKGLNRNNSGEIIVTDIGIPKF